ncbi:MAG: T9SS type A sorting domain-containing protein, partial [Bacteroidia bacterium]
TGYTYLWNNGATTQCRSVMGGTYTVTVTNAAGCSCSSTKVVTACTPPSCTITGSSTCGSTAVQICAPSGTGYTYLWNNGATTQCRSVYAGTYTVTVTNAAGCSCTSSKTVTTCTPPSCSISGYSTCGSNAIQICAPSGTGYTYLWSNGATTQCRYVYAGTYWVTVTNSSGCSSSCSKCVTVSRMMESTVVDNSGTFQVSAYPNPFYESSTIEFQNTKENSHVTIELYDLTGNRIATLFEQDVEQGVTYQAKVNAANLAEGVYIYRLISGDDVINGKLTLIK